MLNHLIDHHNIQITIYNPNILIYVLEFPFLILIVIKNQLEYLLYLIYDIMISNHQVLY